MANAPTYSDTTLIDNRKVTATAGTRVAISSTPLKVAWVDFTGLASNTNTVVVGASTVVAASGTRRGIHLNANDLYTMYDVDLANVYLDSVTDAEGVSYIAGQR